MPTLTDIRCFFHRFLAGGAAALVLTLSILAASPEAHEQVHHDCCHEETHQCAVVLFAHGIWTDLAPVAIAPPAESWQTPTHASADNVVLTRVAHRFPPGCGPPAA